VKQEIVKIREQLSEAVVERNGKIQAEREVFQAETQKVTLEMVNLKARCSSRQAERSASGNDANMGQDQMVRVDIKGQSSECPITRVKIVALMG
jgi:ABC-type phosphate transport system auxiliary subunit